MFFISCTGNGLHVQGMDCEVLLFEFLLWISVYFWFVCSVVHVHMLLCHLSENIILFRKDSPWVKRTQRLHLFQLQRKLENVSWTEMVDRKVCGMRGTWGMLQCVYLLYSKGNQVQGGEEIRNSQAQDKLCWAEIERLFVFLASVRFGQVKWEHIEILPCLFVCLFVGGFFGPVDLVACLVEGGQIGFVCIGSRCE